MRTTLFKPMLLALVISIIGFVSSCAKSEYKGNGSAVFYTTPSNTHGKIQITISGGKGSPFSFTIPQTSNPESFCTSGYTGYVLLDVGTYNYKATAADGKTWSDTFEITKDFCLQRVLL
jgi:hypothetical protein